MFRHPIPLTVTILLFWFVGLALDASAQRRPKRDKEIEALIREARSRDVDAKEQAIKQLRELSKDKPVLERLCELAASGDSRTLPSTLQIISDLDPLLGRSVQTLSVTFVTRRPNDLTEVRRFDEYLQVVAKTMKELIADNDNLNPVAPFAQRMLGICLNPPVKLGSSESLFDTIESSILILKSSAGNANNDLALNVLLQVATQQGLNTEAKVIATKDAMYALGAIAKSREDRRGMIVGILTKALMDMHVFGSVGSWSRSQVAAELLSDLGADAALAVPTLRRIASQGDQRHRTAAIAALEKLAK